MPEAGHVDAVIGAEIAQTIGHQPTPIEFQRPRHVRTMPHHEIGAGIDHRVGEGHDVTAILAVVELLAKGHVLHVRPFRAGVHRHHHDVVFDRKLADPFRRGRNVQHVVSAAEGGKRDHRQRRPSSPKSRAWLLARLITSKPASASQRA